MNLQNQMGQQRPGAQQQQPPNSQTSVNKPGVGNTNTSVQRSAVPGNVSSNAKPNQPLHNRQLNNASGAASPANRLSTNSPVNNVNSKSKQTFFYRYLSIS